MNKEELTTNIGINIKKYRNEDDLGQEDLAFSADLSPTYIGRFK